MTSPRSVLEILAGTADAIEALKPKGSTQEGYRRDYQELIKGIRSKKLSDRERINLLDEFLNVVLRHAVNMKPQDLIAIGLEKAIEELQFDLSRIVAHAYLEKKEDENSPKVNNKYMKVAFALAAARTPEELANNNSTAEHLNKLYNNPHFEEWIKKNSKAAKKLQAMEQDIVNNIAEDLTNMCKRIFSKPIGKEDKSPGEYTNHVTQYVAKCILESDSPQMRARIMTRWINVADTCFKKGDFHTLMAIVQGLNQNAILRLKKPMDLLLSRDVIKRFDELVNYSKVEPGKGGALYIHQEILDRIEKAKPGEKIIPYHGMLRNRETRIKDEENRAKLITEDQLEELKQNPAYVKDESERKVVEERLDSLKKQEVYQSWQSAVQMYSDAYSKITCSDNSPRSTLQEKISSITVDVNALDQRSFEILPRKTPAPQSMFPPPAVTAIENVNKRAHNFLPAPTRLIDRIRI